MKYAMPHITSAELQIMKVLWNLGRATVRQVLDGLPPGNETPPAYTTVMTLMKQLAEKNALDVDRSRQPYVYTPAVRREQVMADRVRQFLHNVFDGQAEDLVLRLVEEADLSPEDLRRIEGKIRHRERGERKGRSPERPKEKEDR